MTSADRAKLRELATRATPHDASTLYYVHLCGALDPLPQTILALLDALDAAERAGWNAAIEACIAIVKTQPYFPDTKVGARQEWVKAKIEEKCRALIPSPGGERE